MTRGLKIRRGSTVVFDSTRAVGGVCLGLFKITGDQTVLAFLYLPRGRIPLVVCSDGTMRSTWYYDESLGYPRFIFPAVAMGASTHYVVGVFLK